MNKTEHVVNGALVAGAFAVLTDPIQLPIAIVLGGTTALFPDLDTNFGTHRKTGHNFFVLGLIVALTVIDPIMIYGAIGVASHFVIDLLSRRGMALFYPFSSREYPMHGGVTVDDDRAQFLVGVMTLFEIGIVVLVV